MRLYSYYDKQAETFSQPLVQHTDGIAIRNFQEAVNNPEMVFHKFPDDFELYYLGDLDESTGLFSVPDDKVYPCLVIKALQLVDKPVLKE